MAFQFPKIDLADAKTRVLIIFAGVIAFVAIIYFGKQFFSSPKTTTGASRVAKAPGNLQSVPGGQLTPEYYRALVQANAQAAKQAQISGGSAVPTLLNEPGAQPSFQQPASSSCTVVCPTDQNVNVESDINELVKAGKLSAEDGKHLTDLARQNVAVSDYAAHLDRLVKQGKLTPDQARKLLGDYKKQHENVLVQESGAAMDALIKSGQLPIAAANELLDLQKKKVSPAEYADKLSQLVKEGKISPQTASQLLAQYSQQHAKEVSAEAVGQLEEMAASGQIKPEVAKELEDYQKRHVPEKEYEEELDHLVKQGKLTPEQARRLLAQYRQQVPPEVADELADYQKRNVPVGEYQEKLQKLVAAGKITPEQAQEMLNQYRQVKSAGAGESAMNDIVRQAEKANQDVVRQLAESGRISPETAQQLMDLQRAKLPVDEYKKQLDDLVRQGKLDPADAQRLLASYTRQPGASVQELLSSGKISPDTAQKLMDMQRTKVPADEYKRQLDQLVREGKISPDDAKKLLNNYQQVKGVGTVEELANTHRITPDAAQQLLEMQRSNVPVDEYKRQLDQMVADGKISSQDAANLLTKYQKLHGVREESDRLAALRANNAAPEDYAAELKQAVEAGTLSPEEAKRLMQEYQTAHAQATVVPAGSLPDVKGAPEFAALQKRIQAATPTVTPPKATTAAPLPIPASNEKLSAVEAKAKALAEQQEQQRLQALMNAMSSQAGQLISSWQPPVMSGQVGSAEKELTPAAGSKDQEKGGSKESSSSSSASGGAAASAGPIIKAGTIFYAILDTAVNSDFPDSPVLATIVSGKFKGAKLLGKLALTQGQDRISLTFKLMNMEDWPTGKTINAYAMDPDTARTVLASEVNYHYFLRYGGLFASSFIQGYANAISSSGSTTSLSVTGSTTTNPVLSPSSKLIAGFGQVGQAFGKAVQGYTSTPPTVMIDPGVSLGILFMADVSG